MRWDAKGLAACAMYYLTTALIYNSNSIKAEQAPKTYDDLLNPAWKAKMVFDPEAGYILAALEQAWGREKALGYLGKLSKQDLSYRRGGTLTTQVVSSGEFPIGIAINGETSAAIRDKGAPLGFKVLAPTIVKPEGLFLAKNAPHPHVTTKDAARDFEFFSMRRSLDAAERNPGFVLARGQIGKVEYLIGRNLLGNALGLPGVADGVGDQLRIDFAVRSFDLFVLVKNL